jgi:hypothetical protein
MPTTTRRALGIILKKHDSFMLERMSKRLLRRLVQGFFSVLKTDDRANGDAGCLA